MKSIGSPPYDDFFRKFGPKAKSCDFSKILTILKGPHRLNFSICDVIFNILHFSTDVRLGKMKNRHFCETAVEGFHKKWMSPSWYLRWLFWGETAIRHILGSLWLTRRKCKEIGEWLVLLHTSEQLELRNWWRLHSEKKSTNSTFEWIELPCVPIKTCNQ